MTSVALAAATVCASLALIGSPASAVPATYNGLIAFSRLNTVSTMRPDGTDVRPVATDLSVDPAWTPDGTQLTFIDTPDPGAPGQNLASTAPDGTGLHTLITGYDNSSLAWSPDSTQFAANGFDAAAHKSTVVFRNADGSNLRQPFIGDAFDERSPAWFPSGDRIAMVRAGNIVAVNADGSGLTTLADDPTLTLGDPSVSRDGSHIAFSNSSDDIFVANADGTGATHVGTKPLGSSASFSPDGTQLVFVSHHNTGIWIVNLDGTGLKQLTAGYADQGPVWQYRSTALPDVPPPATRFNGKLAFERSGELYSANADGTGLTDIHVAAGPVPSWTRDGTTLAAPVGGSYQLMQPDGTMPVCCLGLPGGQFPVLSPDGAKLAYSRSTTNTSLDIFLTDNPYGSTEVDLAIPGVELFPSWSPDGTQIAYQGGTGNVPHVGIMNADGTNAHEVPNQPSGWVAGLPRFSPDGTKLLFGHTPVVNGPIVEWYVIGVDGSGLTQVGPRDRYVNDAAFSPDGSKIVFSSQTPGFGDNPALTDAAAGLYVMNADGSNIHRITAGKDLWVTWQPLITAPANLPPRAIGTAQNSKPLALFANAAASFDEDGTIVSYEWRWGDNTAMTPKKYAWHSYAHGGTYLVRLTVSDNDGAKTTKKAWVTVN